MRRKGRTLCLLACLIIMSFVLVGCPDDDDNGDRNIRNTGRLSLTVTPPEATVTVSGPNDFSFTDAGETSYTLEELAPGNYTIEVSAPGFMTQRQTVRVENDATTQLTFNLVDEPGPPTTGALVIDVAPPEASVTVSGPNNFSFTDAGQASYTLEALEPGNYTVDVFAPDFLAQRSTASVSGGETTRLTFTLAPDPEAGRRAFYIDGDGQLISIPDAALNNPGNFVFHAWLEDLQGGIETDPIAGAPSADEQFEIAPSGTQNLAAAFVGFRVDGNIFPVVNAAVRWEIDRQFEGAVGSVQFGAADDGSNAPGASPSTVSPNAIIDDQADTFTNNGAVRNTSRFPVSETFPLFNMTGIETPDTNGFTWVTLFSPDPRASARIVAVASVNGTEIEKQNLIKNFAPVPELAIRKRVAPQTVIIPEGESARVTFRVVVTNEGTGDALNILHRDRLSDGPLAGYSIDVATLPEGSRPVDQDEDGDFEGFNITIAELAAGESFTFRFDAIVTMVAEQYCNTIRIASFDTEFETMNVNIPAEACFNVIEPDLEIIKDFVDAEGNGLGDSVTVGAGEAARVRVRLINSGTADATGVVLSDVLSEVLEGGNAETYSLSDLPGNAMPVGDDGFNLDIGTIPAGETVSLRFNAQADADGRYCDMVSFVSTAAGTGNDEACLVVATPELTIVKNNTPTESLIPGNTYESTITVTNVGSAPASDVVIRDRIGQGETGTNRFVEFVSSSLNGTAGTFDPETDTVTFAAVNLESGESVTATITSRILEGLAPDNYCDIASFTSPNAGNGQAQACVNVIAFSAIQASLSDEADPVGGGMVAVLNGTLFNELRSNESLINNVVTFNLGEGQFTIQNTRLFIDSDPVVDPDTGTVISGPNDADRELVADTDYTVSADGTGMQTITLASSFALRSNQAIYTVHRFETPDVTEASVFRSNLTWTAEGQLSGLEHQITPEEATTVLP